MVLRKAGLIFDLLLEPHLHDHPDSNEFLHDHLMGGTGKFKVKHCTTIHSARDNLEIYWNMSHRSAEKVQQSHWPSSKKKFVIMLFLNTKS